MDRSTLFGRLDQLFRRGITSSRHDGRWGSHEVRVIDLTGGSKLRCAMDEGRAYWYEVVFQEGDRIRVSPSDTVPPGNAEILTAVLHENGA